MDIIEIPLALIDEDKDQPRYQFNEEALQELMKSIEELGLLSPIKVRTAGNGRYKIIYGNRRYKASQLLGRGTIPCIVSNATDEMEIYLEQIAENLTREGFSPIEEAEAFDKLMNDARFRSSLKFLSAKLGKPESYIKNKCELLKFSNAVKKLIVGGTEIRKDKLTEDQLMPLKDLPMEHRDPLALIAARDELPVSDVKKIAKLFKDKTISDSTKEKLLLKTGSGLIETWSVYEQNRKERARAAEEAKATSARAAANPDPQGGHDGKGAAAAGGSDGAAVANSAAAGAAGLSGGATGPGGSAQDVNGGGATGVVGSAALGGGGQGAAEAHGGGHGYAAQTATGAAGTANAGSAAGYGQPGSFPGAAPGGPTGRTHSVTALLRQLQDGLPRQKELTSAIYRLASSSGQEGEALFAHEIEAVIATLEEQLVQWKALREQALQSSN